MIQKALGAGDVCFRAKVINTKRKVKLYLRETKRHLEHNTKQVPVCPKSTPACPKSTRVRSCTSRHKPLPISCLLEAAGVLPPHGASPWRGDAHKEPTVSDPRNAASSPPDQQTRGWRFCIEKGIKKEKPHVRLENNT